MGVSEGLTKPRTYEGEAKSHVWCNRWRRNGARSTNEQRPAHPATHGDAKRQPNPGDHSDNSRPKTTLASQGSVSASTASTATRSFRLLTHDHSKSYSSLKGTLNGARVLVRSHDERRGVPRRRRRRCVGVRSGSGAATAMIAAARQLNKSVNE